MLALMTSLSERPAPCRTASRFWRQPPRWVVLVHPVSFGSVPSLSSFNHFATCLWWYAGPVSMTPATASC
jgi:hypothetical protein